MTATAKRTTTRLHESAGGFQSIDRDAGIIRGAKVLGLESANNRRYLAEAASRAKGKYEEARIFVDHQREGSGPRSLQEWWGVLRDVRVAADGGLEADIHYNRKHPMTEQLLEAAERFPNRFGLSHVANGTTERDGGVTVVTEIEEVLSVDIVSKPATNQGLFESEGLVKTTFGKLLEQHEGKLKFAKALREDMELGDEGMMAAPVEADEAADPAAQVNDAFRSLCMGVLDDESLDTGAKIAKLRKLLAVKDKAHDAVSGADGKPAAESDAKPSDDAPADDEGKPKSESDELAALKAENAKLKEEKAQAELRSACSKLLTEAGREASEVRIKALMAMPEADRKPLVESWSPAAGPAGDDDEGKPLGGKRPERPKYSPPALRESQDDVGGYPKDSKAFREALRHG